MEYLYYEIYVGQYKLTNYQCTTNARKNEHDEQIFYVINAYFTGL